MMEDIRKRMALITIPFAMALPPIVGWWLGRAIDRWLGSTPWAMYGLIILGFIAGVREAIRIIKRFGDDAK